MATAPSTPDPTAERGPLPTSLHSQRRYCQEVRRDPASVGYAGFLLLSTGTSGCQGADVDKVREATEMVRAKAPDSSCRAPLQYDAAVDPEVGCQEGSGLAVAGRANVLIFPTCRPATSAASAVQRSSGAIAIARSSRAWNSWSTTSPAAPWWRTSSTPSLLPPSRRRADPSLPIPRWRRGSFPEDSWLAPAPRRLLSSTNLAPPLMGSVEQSERPERDHPDRPSSTPVPPIGYRLILTWESRSPPGSSSASVTRPAPPPTSARERRRRSLSRCRTTAGLAEVLRLSERRAPSWRRLSSRSATASSRRPLLLRTRVIDDDAVG